MPCLRRSALAAALLLATWLCLPAGVRAQKPPRAETLFYLTGSDDGFASFRDHLDGISIVAPQAFAVDSDGVVWGEVDPRVLELAKRHGVKVMPLVVNPGFSSPARRRRSRPASCRSRPAS